MTAATTGAPQPWDAAGFESLLRQALVAAGDDPDGVTTFAEAGYTRSRYGLRLALPSGATVHLQIVATRPPDQEGPRRGALPPKQHSAALPAQGKTSLSAVEQHLASALTAIGDPHIRRVEPLSSLGTAVPYGLRVVFHCRAVVCCYLVRATPAGALHPRGGLFPSLRRI